jgi:hypothetical protein
VGISYTLKRKASEGSPTKVRNISYLDATVGNVGKPDPSAALEFFSFFMICRPSRKFAHWRVDAWVEFPRFPNSQGFCEVRKRGSPETVKLRRPCKSAEVSGVNYCPSGAVIVAAVFWVAVIVLRLGKAVSDGQVGKTAWYSRAVP